MNIDLSSSEPESPHFFCYNCYCSFNIPFNNNCCPICKHGELAQQAPVTNPELREPHISLAYLDGKCLWWDEVSLAEAGDEEIPIVTFVKLPENVGFIPRYLFDVEDKVFIDPTDMLPINFNRPMRAAE